ncbi:UNVERIFIED_CONTAM: hypothetical protein Sindi_0820500 [Sesamum indicum]
MADGTRLKELQEAQKKTDVMVMDEKVRRQASEEELYDRMDQMAEVQEASVEKGSSLRAAMNTFRQEGTNPYRQEGVTTFRQEAQSPRNTGSYNALNKLEFPYFDGENARSWVRRCTRYFQMTPILEDQKVCMASIYFQGKVELWYQGYTKKKGDSIVDELIKSILERFEDFYYNRVMTTFNKLQHETTVNAYLERFEELKDQMLIFNKNLEEEFFKMKFISGLKEEIKSLVTTCEPTSLNQAIVLARRQEYAVSAILRKAQPSNRNPHPKPPYNPPLKNLPPRPNYQPKRFLTEAEVRAKKEKNLCYKCDEPYVPGHKCRYRQVYMLLSDEESRDYEDAEQGEPVSATEAKGEEDVIVSLHAMEEGFHCRTLKLEGLVRDKEILILIDSGSTHCFVDEKITKILGCKVENTLPMSIRVADGRKLTSHLVCPRFSWEVQGYKFTHPVKLLKLGGPTQRAPKVQGELSLSQGSSPENDEDPKVLELLQMHQDVFQEPHLLPPKREIEHCIDLLPEAIPKRQHPYRKDWGVHLIHLKKLMELLRKHQLYAKRSKCSFAQKELD